MVTDERPPQVMLATDSFLLGDGLASILADVPDIDIVGRARDHAHLLRLAGELLPDAVIYGIRTSLASTTATISVARRLRREYPEVGFVVISDRADGFATELLRDGASRVADRPRASPSTSSRTARSRCSITCPTVSPTGPSLPSCACR